MRQAIQKIEGLGVYLAPQPLITVLGVKYLHLRVEDGTDLYVPFDQLTEFRHPETGERIIGDPAVLKTRYLERLQAYRVEIVAACQKAQAELLQLHNGDDLARLLSLHFIRRLAEGAA